MGNLRSVLRAMEHVAPDADIVLTSDAKVVTGADKVVFPGQGAMRDCMAQVEQRGLRDAIVNAAYCKPFLGICVGAQLLFEHSEEGDSAGLGIFAGKVVRFPSGQKNAAGDTLKVPHMGWNTVTLSPHPLWSGIESGQRFYFVHSYYMVPADNALTIAEADYPFRFTAAVARGNIFATQFHPEKSQADGLRLLKNFVQWDGTC